MTPRRKANHNAHSKPQVSYLGLRQLLRSYACNLILTRNLHCPPTFRCSCAAVPARAELYTRHHSLGQPIERRRGDRPQGEQNSQRLQLLAGLKRQSLSLAFFLEGFFRSFVFITHRDHALSTQSNKMLQTTAAGSFQPLTNLEELS